MNNQKHWWDGHESEIINLLKDNKNLKEIANVFGVSTVSVWRATRKLDKTGSYSTSLICWEDEKSNIEKMVLEGLTYSEIADKYNTSDTTMRRHISELGIDKRLINPRTKHKKYSDEDIISAAKKNYSYAGVLKEIGLKPIGGNYAYIRKRIDQLKVDTSHFTGQLWSKGKTKDKDGIKTTTATLDEIFAGKAKIRSATLKERLINAGIKERRCECCKNTEWNGKPIPLELHHKDGDHDNNSLSNLQILCPNCHAQTDFYCGKGTSRSNYDIPDKDQLLDKLRECKTIKALAKSYNVSESTIKSWVRKNDMKKEYEELLKEIRKH